MPPLNRVHEASSLLKERIEGEIRTDKLSRQLYSTDASIYQVEPYGVVLPKNERDIIHTVQVAHRYGIPVIARAGGTSLAGQCVGKGWILDISKYMNQLIELNSEEQWAWVQPGVIQDELSRLASPYGLYFAPDTSTSNRAMIGGMIGNNSCGSHSIYYGRTLDHTYEMDVVLSDGSTARFCDLTPEELERKKQQDNLEGHIYREVTQLVDTYRELIQERYPKLMRRNTGYLLDELIDESKPFNLSRLICGSEGTLALISQVRMKLVPQPKYNGLLTIQCSELNQALHATVEAIQHGPAAIELIDDVILDLAKDIRATKHLQFFIEGSPEAILVVEFYGEDHTEVETKMTQLEAVLTERGWGYAHTRIWGDDMEKVWQLRKAGLGVLMGMPGDSKPVTFVEDTAVPPEHLPDYITDFRAVMKKYDTYCTYYAHASVGELHMRPILNLKEQEDREKMAAIADEVVDLVMKYDGSVSGEHGDGRVRSPFHKKFFGEELYEAHRKLKHIFDPKGILNPNKITDPPPLLSDLRKPEYPMEVDTVMSFKKDQGYLRAAEFCNGAGACRKTHHAKGTMCPSYQATLDEMHTTRGRANMLRNALADEGPVRAFMNPELNEVMHLCLECKACKSECPSNVDLAKLKYEFLQKRHDLMGTPLYAWATGNIALINKINEPIAPFVNWFLRTRIGRFLTQKVLRVDPRRAIPEVITPTTRAWFFRRRPHPNAGINGKKVFFFADPFTNYNEPEIGKAAIEVLEALGFEVHLSPIENDGRSLISKGLLRKAKALAQHNLQHFERMLDEDGVLVGIEPSSVLTFRDEYLDFFPNDSRMQTFSKRCFQLDEFLVQEAQKGTFEPPFIPQEGDVLLHGHCMQKALSSVQPTLDMLELIPGVRASAIASGCCGMAGSFGYEIGKYDVSMQIGELTLFPAVRNRKDARVVATGTSCRHQIYDGTEYKAQHPIQLLAEALPPLP